MIFRNPLLYISILLLLCSCSNGPGKPGLPEQEEADSRIISRAAYANQLYGFWLGQNIANWTGLVTEMDKIGDLGDIRTGAFYTRDDWGTSDQPSIWGEGVPSDLSPTIDFVFRDTNEIWGSDDDTDIEYLYQYLMLNSPEVLLSPQQIRDGWMNHILPEEENYLWVSNQRAYDLMRQGILPPETGNPELNEHYDKIDAQLTTELFGLFAPGRPDVALRLAALPIQTTARNEAASIARFYVVMHALAPISDSTGPMRSRVFWMAEEARKVLPEETYPAAMFDYVNKLYHSGIPWEQARDSVYFRYQVQQADGYDITSRNVYCNGCFAAGINFAASLVSLFYGEGDLKETIKIGTLAGWDSDNPTATWGGLLGFMIGKDGIEATFGRTFSNRYNIHRTRQGFPNNALDTFERMAENGLQVTDKVVQQEMGGTVDAKNNRWIIPLKK